MPLTVGDKLGPNEFRSRVVAGSLGELSAHKRLFEKSGPGKIRAGASRPAQIKTSKPFGFSVVVQFEN